MVNYGKTWFTTQMPELWLFALGALFVLVTLLMPRGLVGLLSRRERPAPAVEKKDAVSSASSREVGDA